MIHVENVSKTFTLHNQNSAVIEVVSRANLAVQSGECVALTGVSGSGKSTLMRMIYGNYLSASGSIRIGDVDVANAEPREIQHFFQSFCNHAFVTLHIENFSGENTHHQIETIFKAFGRALRMALEIDTEQENIIPSTKGAL